MSPPTEFRDVFAGLHLDAAGFVAFAGIAFWRVTRALRAPRTPAVLERNLAVRLALFVGLALAMIEFVAPMPIHGAESSAGPGVALIRALLFAAAAAIFWFWLSQVAQRARFRAQVRVLTTRRRADRLACRAAESANKAKSEYLVGMSHEIRTPLNALLAAADAALRMPLDRLQRTQLTRVVNESNRLGRTLNEVLDLRRIEQGDIALHPMPFDPGAEGREVVELFLARAEEKRLELRLVAETPPGLVISGDPRRFRQVLANLIDNAIKFTTRGSVTVTLSYTPATRAGSVSLIGAKVADTGIGITAAHRAALLSGAAARPSSAGTPPAGLGLTIAQRLVRLMGGEIIARNLDGEGSEFAFTLAVQVVHAPPSAEPAAAALPEDARRRVLIVDDIAANRVMLQMFLEQQGFRADYASGGEQAVQLATRNHYDAILMDLQMPEIDGFTATRRIRSTESPGNRTVIVAVTAAGDGVTREQCFAAGMDGHFGKPVDLRKLCTELTDLIAARQRKQSDAQPASLR